MTDATYSELIEAAGTAAERAFNAALTSEPPDAEHLAAALARLDYYGRSHLDRLHSGGRLTRTTTRTAALWSDRQPGEGYPAISALQRTADLLGAAHDLLPATSTVGRLAPGTGSSSMTRNGASAMTLVSCVSATHPDRAPAWPVEGGFIDNGTRRDWQREIERHTATKARIEQPLADLHQS